MRDHERTSNEWQAEVIRRHIRHAGYVARERRRRALFGALLGLAVGALAAGGMVLVWGTGW